MRSGIYIYIYILGGQQRGRQKIYKCTHLAVSLCELLLAVAVKKNYLIFAIGYIIFCFMNLIKRKNLHTVVPIIAATLIVLFSHNLVFFIAEKITGCKTSGGNPTLSWIVMGLGENKVRYDGWWDPSIDQLFADADYDTAATGCIALERVQYRLKQFIAAPEYAIRFFSGKNASQWNTPLFDAYYVNSGSSGVYDSLLQNALFDAVTRDILMRILNPLHFAVLAGAVFYLLLKKDKSDVSLFFCVVFVGGFMFHTVWEAKGQYTLPYFTLLLPLAVEGYAEAIHIVLDFPHLPKKRRITVISSLAAFIVFGAVICWGNSTLLNDIFVRSEDTESYISYLNDAE